MVVKLSVQSIATCVCNLETVYQLWYNSKQYCECLKPTCATHTLLAAALLHCSEVLRSAAHQGPKSFLQLPDLYYYEYHCYGPAKYR